MSSTRTAHISVWHPIEPGIFIIFILVRDTRLHCCPRRLNIDRV
jgi:hypothetical protein